MHLLVLLKIMSVSFAAFGIQHAMPMRRGMLSVVWPALQYFSTLSHKRHDCRKRILNIKRVFSNTLPETFTVLRRTERNIVK
jgi:hypothetical protein